MLRFCYQKSLCKGDRDTVFCWMVLYVNLSSGRNVSQLVCVSDRAIRLYHIMNLTRGNSKVWVANHESILLCPGAASVDIQSVLIRDRVRIIYILALGFFCFNLFFFVCLFCFSMFLPVPFLLLEVSAQNDVWQWLTHHLVMCQGSYRKSEVCTVKLFGSC